ncbi:hypothetical protein [Sphingomonas sp. CFBP 13720]|jgi:hypothetical protein|uniref:hypothetical protein n=1 Tax=Sphingomonas sp. CFBP 13720 TaxID=2775302 RepID=UPI001784C1DB|nr:hypothetical protein [Sphingomonas sp. CFBP 13720]MBD8679224.1 hypothetical protein [Sphingomonas sp. CFBP 13720]
MIAKFVTALAASSLVAAPVLAAPAPAAAKLSVAKQARASATPSQKNKLAGAGPVALALIAGIAAIGVVAIVKGEEDSDSN